MSSLLSKPFYLPEHLGRPLPDSRHAVSVCLPTWRDVVGYEQGEPRVINALQAGYPRFVYHPLCREYFEQVRRQLNLTNRALIVLPSASAARRCADFIGPAAQVHPLNYRSLHATSYPPALADRAKQYWQHAGEGISSRIAEAALSASASAHPSDPSSQADAPSDERVKHLLRRRIASLAGASADDVYLYPTGMAAIFTLHRALRTLWPAPGRPTAQFGFPYVDTLKILEKFSDNTAPLFFPTVNKDSLDRLAAALADRPIAGLFTELPSNPLLTSPDLVRLAALARASQGPLIVDETLATWINADVLHLADVSVTSLTKFFSGAGDAAGGCLILSRHGLLYDQLKSTLELPGAGVHEDLLDDADAVTLEHNSRDFPERMRRINTSAALLGEYLARHPRVAKVHYPMLTTASAFDQVRKVDGGFGGLLSIELHNPHDTAPRLYDALRCCKGPNLGTNFTLVCPYTLLAHFNELQWAESCGVSRWLVRISVGLENVHDLIQRFDAAFDTLT